ncbi:hypothetical protein L1987_59962 [Smallanthus sonchifolius]|uniref:Uncharacterized protein n=1 Tax=Smallanthus sonchifolius TaxID=185202 RepID=A0ACB9D6S2_9ASTR|nr:hypothetical protein L1987_59962 [Smallanthus sonchifolius]
MQPLTILSISLNSGSVGSYQFLLQTPSKSYPVHIFLATCNLFFTETQFQVANQSRISRSDQFQGIPF